MFEVEYNNRSEFFDGSLEAENCFYCLAAAGYETWLYCLGNTLLYFDGQEVTDRNEHRVNGSMPIWLGKRVG